jgi:hypothetical protein
MKPDGKSEDPFPEFTFDPPSGSPDGPNPASARPPVDLDEVMRQLAERDAARQLEPVLLRRMKERLPDLERLACKVEGHWGIEDGFYRFYHQSWKVYGVQTLTKEIVTSLTDLLPERPLNESFMTIVTQGTEKKFEMSHNTAWLEHTRPIIEALFHAHYFLKMVCKYARELEAPPQMMPSGWAAVLYLYGMR